MPQHLPPVVVSGTPGAGALVFSGQIAGGDELILRTTGNTDITLPQSGSFVESNILAASGISLTDNTPATITSISLAAGKWDVFGLVGCIGVAGTTMTFLRGSSSLTSAAHNLSAAFDFHCGSFTLGAGEMRFAVPTAQFVLAASDTIYLVATAWFAAGTMKGFGRISARRAL